MENREKPPLIILSGPTAVGKTEISIELAKTVNGEIISADSIQVYKYMDIGSAKIKPDEMQGIKHYLIDEIEPDVEFNVMLFQKLAQKYIKEIIEKGKIPIIAGGTGFYIQAVLYGIDFTEGDTDLSYRNELLKLSDENGPEFLYEKLKETDPEYAYTVHANNKKRVIRALEYYHQTGLKFSEHNLEQRQKESPYNFAYFVLTDDREKLYSNIEKRIDIMIRNGLVNEVNSLLTKGYGRELVSMQGLGYKEIAAYIYGEMTLDDAIEVIKRDTRHFAKRQLTWFRREKEVMFMDKSVFGYDNNLLLDKMLEILENKGITANIKA